MEMQTILFFALIGAVCMIIVTGGFVSMTTDTEPSSTTLASGAAVGGTLGAAFSYLSSSDMPSMISNFTSPVTEMKVGLPAF